MRPVFAAAIVWLLVSRAYEMVRSRRAARELLARGGRRLEPDGFLPLALVHVGWIAALIVEEQVAGPAALPVGLRAVSAVVFVAAELLRFACMRELGPRWNVHVLVLPGARAVTGGPYRWMRHPNYFAAAVGLVALPLALGLVWTAALVLPLKLLALRRRIRLEDEALAASAPRPPG